MKLPFLPPEVRIVDPMTGMPSVEFRRWWEEVTQQIGDVGDTVTVTSSAIGATQAQTQALAESVAGAQASADSGGTARSGSATDPDVDLSGTGWFSGPLVNLTGVSAGDLTITGSRPLANPGSATLTGNAFVAGEFRVVEVVGGVDTTVFTGQWAAEDSSGGEQGVPSSVLITGDDAADVQAFSSARVSTGAVSYRLDMRRTSGAIVNNLKSYLYVRRS